MMIDPRILRKMPSGNFVRTGVAAGMDVVSKDAILWMWFDHTGLRKAWFSIEDGEYLTEDF